MPVITNLFSAFVYTFRGTNLKGANLKGTNFNGANLRVVN